MVRLREIPRTAAFAWSPGPNPLVATGTRSGAVDADFSDETKLELWDLNLDAPDHGLELQPMSSISTESRFYDIAWGAPSDEHPRGVIAGAMEDGSLQLWDAAKLLAGEEALMARATKHTGPIKALQFNPIRPQVLATAGAKGELFVWDINDTSTAFRLGTAAAHDIDCVAWNRKVSNILATGSAGGFVTVWDLKTKKASLTLNNNRKPVSAIAWDPNNSTNLLTATSDDNTPVILLWNLRNSQAPEKTLQGHDQGILSLSWCQQDAGLLVSCGKDNRTLVWNPQTGERYGEFPESTNWVFSTRFNPDNPNLSAAASFDGKITIQTLQNTNPSAVPASQTNMDDDDFFSKAPTQLQGASFSLARAPAWFEPPVGVSFGYGGKLIIFKKNDTPAGQPRSSKIQISSFSVDSDIGSATEKFEEAFSNGDIAGICDSHLANAKTEEEKADWQVLKTLSEMDGRTKIIEHLGFPRDEDDSNAAEEAETSESKEEPKETGLAPPQPNGKDAAKKTHKRVTSMWADVDDGDDFLSDLTAAKGAKTENPFHLLSEGNTALEDQITRAILLGNFEKAVNICLKDGRIADAFILANCGGKELVEKVQTTYLSQKKGSPSYLRLISSIITKNLWDIVYNADLANWKETMVSLCTFAEPSEFPDLCEALGDRIFETGSRKDASFCYLVGSKLEKVVDIWIAELQEAEQAGLKESSDDSSFSVHARALQHFIEKVTVFRHVTKFADSEKNLTEGWKLAPLYDKYTEYADIAAAHGQLAIAQRYLDLLPTSFPAAEVARNRVTLASRKAVPQAAPRQAAPTSRSASRAAAPVGYQQPAAIPPVGPSPLNPYAPAVQPQPAAPVQNPYAPTTTSQYQPPGSSTYAQGAGYVPSPPSVGGYGPPPTFGQPGTQGPPPRSTGPPPKINKDAGNWNDVPMVTKPPVRKTTPSAPPVTSPFPGQTSLQSPPPAGPYQRSAPTPPPPPPKGSAPPRNVTSPPVGPPPAGQLLARTPSVASNASTNPYAPPPPAAAGIQPPMVPPVPRTASPYNPPPPGPPPTSRYAPAPAAQPYGPGPSSTPLAPPPANPYAPAPAAQPLAPPPSQYAAPPPQVSRPPVGPPPASGPPPAAGGVPPAARASAAEAPPRAAAPSPQKPRHPPGDRSHIPPNAQQLVETLSQDMQRVAAKAPASFAPQVKDTQKRLGLLFDHLNNGELVKADTVEQLSQLAAAVASKNYEAATKLQVEIQRDKTEECGQWMVGVKRLISMSKATP
ncbi:Protein transport protein SEC31 [Madurella mycetomatis]|uniref:Protein transport protein SEC31 n=1 Tax=Madurella mycetomatis TaxID=100816 RepID=A0A175W258_9PEZI|nr:Protein transport protein SEC31 [Madurella mycetomatis]